MALFPSLSMVDGYIPDHYRVLVANVKSGDILEELPVTRLNYSHVLNRPGSAEFSIPYNHPKARQDVIYPCQSIIYIERHGQLVWSGLVWTARMATRDRRVVFGAEGMLSYLGRRAFRDTREYVHIDQLQIARNIINYAQTRDHGNIRIHTARDQGNYSGRLRIRRYWRYERKNILEAIEQLSEVIDGFDFSLDPEWFGQEALNVWKSYYPRKGRPTGIVVEPMRNLEDISLNIDGTRQANVVDVMGAGEGEDMTIGYAADFNVMEDFPRLERNFAHTGVSRIQTAKSHADNYLQMYKLPTYQPHFSISTTAPESDIGLVETGDTVVIRVSEGYMTVNDAFRVMSRDVNVSTGGEERVQLDFGREEATGESYYEDADSV